RGPIAVIPIGAAAEGGALTLTQTLRHDGYAVDLGFGGSLRKRMKRADKAKARAVVLLGEDELARNAASVRDLDSGDQEVVGLDALTERLARYR
ncbi:MAG: His/Gly/Thr/Pro-type tRNA ligase C-terminal domain-containing protein, partial [Dongiaceae bacterium]